jgi:hypothetical protein
MSKKIQLAEPELVVDCDGIEVVFRVDTLAAAELLNLRKDGARARALVASYVKEIRNATYDGKKVAAEQFLLMPWPIVSKAFVEFVNHAASLMKEGAESTLEAEEGNSDTFSPTS